jgi:hypothetical protein
MSWNIFSIFECHMEIIEWCNEIFCHITSMGRSKINNGLLTLNMSLAKKVIKSIIVWAFESKQKLKDAFYHPSCSKCLMLLDNDYNIFKNVEMGEICILDSLDSMHSLVIYKNVYEWDCDALSQEFKGFRALQQTLNFNSTPCVMMNELLCEPTQHNCL